VAVPAGWLGVPLVALGLVLAWAALQTVPWVPEDWRHPVWRMLPPIVGHDVPGAISVYPAAGWMAMLWLATAAAAFFLAVQFGRDAGRARIALRVVAGVGGCIAGYGLVVYGLGNHWVLWEPKHAYVDSLTATFINRNTCAAYAGVTMVCALGLVLDRLIERRAAVARGEARRSAWGLVAEVLFYTAVAVAACAALLLTGSRAGLAVSVLGVAAAAMLLVARARTGRWIVLAALLALAVGGVVLGAEMGDALMARLQTFDGDLADRLALDGRVIAAIEASPWLGYGLGAFEHAIPAFQDGSLYVHNRWEYAHNDWLEALMTLGVPAGLLLWLVVGWILWRCLAGAVGRGRDTVFGAVATGAGLLAVTHSLVDFSLQIQGFTLPLLALLGAGVAQSWSSRREV
jgi:O-antigen ligase